ncbi:MAG: dihydroxyacetone kinase subunit L [Firmicutes bacterium]|nr:dihydroxyacetone kinase subunit L [Candidatus Colimorpha enterica]
MNTEQVIGIIALMGKRMEQEKEFLTDLDNAIADGDHGINMARGFAAVEAKIAPLGDKDIGTVLKTAGMTLVSAVGGSAGPLYGTAFMRSGVVMNGKTEMNIADLTACLKASVEGVMQRGKAVKGEKTMLDSMIPALEAIENGINGGLDSKDAVLCGVKAAREGVEYTKTIAATKGRASYIGERSIGHQDPGATSFTYLLEVIADAL